MVHDGRVYRLCIAAVVILAIPVSVFILRFDGAGPIASVVLAPVVIAVCAISLWEYLFAILLVVLIPSVMVVDAAMAALRHVGISERGPKWWRDHRPDDRLLVRIWMWAPWRVPMRTCLRAEGFGSLRRPRGQGR